MVKKVFTPAKNRSLRIKNPHWAAVKEYIKQLGDEYELLIDVSLEDVFEDLIEERLGQSCEELTEYLKDHKRAIKNKLDKNVAYKLLGRR